MEEGKEGGWVGWAGRAPAGGGRSRGALLGVWRGGRGGGGGWVGGGGGGGVWGGGCGVGVIKAAAGAIGDLGTFSFQRNQEHHSGRRRRLLRERSRSGSTGGGGGGGREKKKKNKFFFFFHSRERERPRRFFRGEVDKYTGRDVGSSFLARYSTAGITLGSTANRHKRSPTRGLRNWQQLPRNDRALESQDCFGADHNPPIAAQWNNLF